MDMRDAELLGRIVAGFTLDDAEAALGLMKRLEGAAEMVRKRDETNPHSGAVFALRNVVQALSMLRDAA